MSFWTFVVGDAADFADVFMMGSISLEIWESPESIAHNAAC